MNIDGSGDADKCEQLLRTPLTTPGELRKNDEKHLRKALGWYRGDTEDPLRLTECMAITRIVGEELSIRLDTGNEYHYLRFDTERNRVVLIDPNDMAEVPVEETSITDIFQSSTVSFTTAQQIKPKTFEFITAVTNDEHGTKLVLGKYNESFTTHSKDGETITYKPKTTFSLPEQMTPGELDEWLDSDESETVKAIVKTNHERGWGDNNANPSIGPEP